MSGLKPTGTLIAAALEKPSVGATLPLTVQVPNPGRRFGKADVIKNTLMQMAGDQSFTMKDATLVYMIAKQIGVKITTRKEGGMVRVWRIK